MIRTTVLIAICFASCFAHECIHDSILERVTPITNVVQKYAQPVGDGDVGQSFAPIRIYLDTRFVSIADSNVKNFLMTSLLPAAVSWIRSALSVQPVSGNLTLAKQCKRYIPQPYQCLEYWDPTSCLEVANVPPEHLVPGGKGIPNADIILYVTSKETQGNTLAYASACMFDQKNRPIAGNINFGPKHISIAQPGSQLFLAQVATAVHEMFHALGFSSSSFPKYLGDDGKPYAATTRTFTERGDQVTKIVTPRAMKFAQNHFNCPSLNGAEIENRGGSGSAGSHWKKRIFNEEFMTASQSNLDFTVYSGLTLSLMEDSGWYKANYSATGTLLWGRNRGCNFALDRCMNNGIPMVPTYFCNSTTKNSCTVDRRARGTCGLVRYTTPLPKQCQYFSDPAQGGDSEFMDFCPSWNPFVFNNGPNSVCTDIANLPSPSTNYWGEGYGPAARCFESTVVDSSFSRFIPNQGSSCHTFTCSPFRVKVGSQTVDCSVPGKKTVPGFRGDFTCPSPQDVGC